MYFLIYFGNTLGVIFLQENCIFIAKTIDLYMLSEYTVIKEAEKEYVKRV